MSASRPRDAGGRLGALAVVLPAWISRRCGLRSTADLARVDRVGPAVPGKYGRASPSVDR